MKIINIILASCLLAGCAPSPQYCSSLVIMNCTETTLSVQSNLICPRAKFPSVVSYEPGECRAVAESLAYPDSSSITIDKFITNHDDAAVSVTATIDGVQITRTWKYTERNNGQKQLFNLNDCLISDSEDRRKNFTCIDYIFMIQEEDLRE